MWRSEFDNMKQADWQQSWPAPHAAPFKSKISVAVEAQNAPAVQRCLTKVGKVHNLLSPKEDRKKVRG